MFRERLYPYFILRVWLVAALTTGMMLFLVWRLWQIQGRREERYAQRVAHQSIRRIRVEAVRGRMFAADGTLLVDNRPSYDLVFHPAEMRQPGRHTRTIDYILSQGWTLAQFLGRPVPLTKSKLQRHLRTSPALPISIFQDLNAREMARIEELTPRPPGLEIVPAIVRDYPFPGVATHVLGFTGKRLPNESRTREPDGDAPLTYIQPEYAGREGLERYYDQELAGRSGEKLVLVDILGYVHEEVGTSRPPQAGNDLILSLDARAQCSAERALQGYTGALVVVDADTGGILAMASSPTYSLGALTPQRYRELARDRLGQPLLNRAIGGAYLPGSVLKPLTAAAALQCHAVTPQTTVDCTGCYLLGQHSIRCWKRDGHGVVNLNRALAESCNTFFITIGLAVGFDRFLPLLTEAGLGDEPRIDLPGAVSGFLPSRAWARKQYRRDWGAGETAYLAIGQGAIDITPLQAALYCAALANGGTVYRPYLVQGVRDQDGTMRRVTAPLPRHHLSLDDSVMALVRHGMQECVNGPHGSGVSARTPVVSLAGKTGTAEVDSRDTRLKNTWFIGFGPAENPQFALALVIERGESGGHTASPLVRKFLDGWLGEDIAATPTP